MTGLRRDCGSGGRPSLFAKTTKMVANVRQSSHGCVFVCARDGRWSAQFCVSHSSVPSVSVLMFTVRPSNRRCVVWHMAPYALVALKKPMHECKNSFC